jgi:hypothetical protein
MAIKQQLNLQRLHLQSSMVFIRSSFTMTSIRSVFAMFNAINNIQTS